ncbi:hypothetical protein JKG47_08745 [Acidithiobacillus sp. MC6.1]|nr:hypothetical protein [Acidithiobacillus sp. MC6.1]
MNANSWGMGVTRTLMRMREETAVQDGARSVHLNRSCQKRLGCSTACHKVLPPRTSVAT